MVHSLVLVWLASAGLSALALVAWLRAARLAVRLGRLEDVPAPPPEASRSLSVIVAARDEARELEATIRGLLALEASDLEVIVVDDRSSDDTPALLARLAAEDPRLVPLRIDRLPEGWLGKPHALAAAVAVAHGDWWLFTDADVSIAPDAVGRAIAAAEAAGADQLCVVPDYRPPSPVLALPIAAASQLLLAGARADRIGEAGGRFLGLGAFNLVRAEAFRRTAGFHWLRAEVLDDMGVALLLAPRGRVLRSTHLVHLAWYRSLGAMARGLEKVFWAGAAHSPARLGLQALGLAAFALGPFLALASGAPAAMALGAAALLVLLALAALRRARFGTHPALSLLAPIGQLGLSALMLRALVTGVRRGGLAWRDTHYPFALLRSGRRVDLRRPARPPEREPMAKPRRGR